MNLSRVTWLVLGTTMVLVSAVLVAAVFFINGGSEPFPRGTGGGGSGVARVGSASVEAPGPGRAARAVRVSASASGRQVAAHPAVAGLAASLGPAGIGGRSRPRGPTGHQYGDSLQQLNAKLWGH